MRIRKPLTEEQRLAANERERLNRQVREDRLNELHDERIAATINRTFPPWTSEMLAKLQRYRYRFEIKFL